MRFYENNPINTLEFVLILCPSLVLPFMVEAFELGKTLFIILLLSFSLISYKFFPPIKKTGVSLSFSTNKNRLSYVDLLFFGYLFLYILSSLFATDIGTAVLGYYGRFAGSLLFLSTLILFLVKNKQAIKDWGYSRISYILSLGSLVPVLLAYIQIFNTSSLTETSGRLFSTFGQPNWFGGYLVIVLLIHTISYVFDRRNIALFYFVFTLIPLFYTVSLSSILSLFFALCLFWLISFARKSVPRLNILLLFFIFTTLLHGSSLFGRFNNQIFAKDTSENSIITNDTGYIRGILTRSAFLQVLNSPKLLVIGSGPENFAYEFKRPAALNKTSEWSYLYNKPHNFFIEEFFETGILGLLFFIGTFILLLKSLKNNIYYILPLAIMFNSFFGWLTSYTYLLLFIFLVKFFLEESFNEMYLNIASRFKIKSFIVYDLLFVFALIYSFSLFAVKTKPCLSYRLFPYYQNFAMDCLSANLTKQNIESIIQINPKNRLIKENVALKILKSNPTKSQELTQSLKDFDPTNPIYFYYLGQIYEKQGLKEEAKKEYQAALNLQPKFIEAKSRMIYLK